MNLRRFWAPHTHTPVIGLIFKRNLGFSQVMLGNQKKEVNSIIIHEDSRRFFCSSRPVELCTQILLLLHADATEV